MYNDKDDKDVSKFDFYEVVKFINARQELNIKTGSEGVILAKGKNRYGTWNYVISTDSGAISLTSEGIESTGKFVKREDIYSGESVKVAVDEQGRGYAKDHPDAALIDDDEMK